MKRAGTAVLVAGMTVAGLAGCESGQTASQGATTTAAPALWNPCAEIPDEVLRAAGVDPGTEESGLAGVPQPGWEICGWRGPEYSLTVYTTGKTVAQFEQKPGNIDFADVTIANRAGRQFRIEGDTRNAFCDVVFPAQQGVVQLGVNNSAIADGPLDEPCTYLQRAGAVLVPVLPN
ncbi:DUF3558 domain-containing protein [Nocardia asteroides]|uniref:DUF3558 domain-containing protein n=1 Tax=Nocardia asteroides TaxID=1824 RepID=UPI001E50752E|nr:DUF3558 domain-containing protein [Nocardia asteroides]UGT58289.1 DUF3558 domain-containing protein [Nocardia asteroides]